MRRAKLVQVLDDLSERGLLPESVTINADTLSVTIRGVDPRAIVRAPLTPETGPAQPATGAPIHPGTYRQRARLELRQRRGAKS